MIYATEKPNWKSHYLTLMKNSNFSYWHGETEYLKGITDPHAQLVTATVLENQRNLLREINPLACSLTSKIVSRLPFKVVSIQPMSSPCSRIIYSKQERNNWYQQQSESLALDEVVAITRILPFGVTSTGSDVVGIDPAAIGSLASSIVGKICTEIATDIWSYCCDNTTIIPKDSSSDHIAKHITSMKDVILHNTGKEANRLLTSQAIYSQHKNIFKSWQTILTIDDFKGIVVFIKEDNYFGSPYVYCPYILPHLHLATGGIKINRQPFIRYAKKLIRGGKTHFAKIELT
jgi:hypothetical protein